MSCMGQNFRLFHVSNLFVQNIRIFLLMYPGSSCRCRPAAHPCTGRSAFHFRFLPSRRAGPGRDETGLARTGRGGRGGGGRGRQKACLPANACRQRPRIQEQNNSKFLERIISMRETDVSFDSCNSCKRLVPSLLHGLHELKLAFLSHIEVIRSNLPISFCSCIRCQREAGSRSAGIMVGRGRRSSGSHLSLEPHGTRWCSRIGFKIPAAWELGRLLFKLELPRWTLHPLKRGGLNGKHEKRWAC